MSQREELRQLIKPILVFPAYQHLEDRQERQIQHQALYALMRQVNKIKFPIYINWYWKVQVSFKQSTFGRHELLWQIVLFNGTEFIDEATLPHTQDYVQAICNTLIAMLETHTIWLREQAEKLEEFSPYTD